MEQGTTMDERAFHQAREDARATFAPRAAILGSGFVAGFIITWLPLIVYLVIFLWEAFLGRTVAGESKFALAFANLLSNWGAYASVAWIYSIVVGLFGVLLAYLRALSCLMNVYLRFDTDRGTFRLGIHQMIGLIGVPVCIGVVANILIGDPAVFYVLLVPIAISGLLFNIAFGTLQNAALGFMYRPSDLELTIKALEVFVPRRMGAHHARISEIRIDGEKKIAEVFGVFDSDATRKEVREIVSHFLRGYNPVHVRDAEEQVAS